MPKYFKQKGFTLVEMIIVVVVLGILIGMGINRLSNLDADRYYSESCINTLYGTLSEWVYYSATSKMLSGEVIPTQYLIYKEPQHSGFTLRYKEVDKDGTETEKRYISGFLSEVPTCQKGKKYQVKATFDFDKIVMLPSLISRGNQNGFEIWEGTTLLPTGTIHFRFCSPDSEVVCREFGEIIFDARTAMIKKRFCKLYHAKDAAIPDREKTCRERSTGS